MSKPYLSAALLSASLFAAPLHAAAQNADRNKEAPAKRVLSFLAGGAAGLIAHEAGHLAAGFASKADPGFRRLDYGVIPFFVVTHDPVSRRREYVISASGFFVQHAANEWLLGGPSMRSRSAPFKKGWLTFNLATSALYAAAAFGRFGPPERDTLGMARHAGPRGVPEAMIGTLVLVPATLDAVRYLEEDPAWARWTSRAVKAVLVLIAVR